MKQIPLEQLKREIPRGPYCYSAGKKCKYWSINPEAPPQQNGHCAFLERGDWESDDCFGHLWDSIKECGINLDEENDHLTM